MRAAAGTDDISGADNPGGVALAAGKLTAAQQAACRQYVTAIALLVPAGTAAQAGTLLRDQQGVVQYSASMPTNGTQVQVGPVLDSLYGASAAGSTLGVTFDVAPPMRRPRAACGATRHRMRPGPTWRTTPTRSACSVAAQMLMEPTPGGSVALLTAPE